MSPSCRSCISISSALLTCFSSGSGEYGRCLIDNSNCLPSDRTILVPQLLSPLVPQFRPPSADLGKSPGSSSLVPQFRPPLADLGKSPGSSSLVPQFRP